MIATALAAAARSPRSTPRGGAARMACGGHANAADRSACILPSGRESRRSPPTRSHTFPAAGCGRRFRPLFGFRTPSQGPCRPRGRSLNQEGSRFSQNHFSRSASRCRHATMGCRITAHRRRSMRNSRRRQDDSSSHRLSLSHARSGPEAIDWRDADIPRSPHMVMAVRPRTESVIAGQFSCRMRC